MPRVGPNGFFAVINTQEQPIEVFSRHFQIKTDHEDGVSFTTESGQLYCYGPIGITEMPLDELTIYEVYEWEEDSVVG